jgi:hypothetical protein
MQPSSPPKPSAPGLMRLGRPSCLPRARPPSNCITSPISSSPTRHPFADLGAVRAAVQSHLLFLREPLAPHVDDVALLRDVADAFKHHKLDRPNATVAGAEAIIMTGTGWGKLRYGEGKWGGTEQVIVERKSGDQRALSSVLQNVHDAWLTLLGEPLPPINQF